MAKLNYKITKIDVQPLDDHISLYLEVTSDLAAESAVNVECCYGLDPRALQVESHFEEPTRVPFGSTMVDYDGGMYLDKVDAEFAVTLFEYFICDADNEPLHDTLKWDKGERAAAIREAAKLISCTEEELISFLDTTNSELLSKAITAVEEYYTEDPDLLPESAWQNDDWYDVDWD